MEKVIVTLRSAPSESVEVPKFKKGAKGEKGEKAETARSCFGALRFFPGIPKTITKDELEFIKGSSAELFRRLSVRPYVESKRVDKRGATEDDVEKAAEKAGVGHLPAKKKLAVLAERGLIGSKAAPPPKKPDEAAGTKATRKRNGNGGK